MKHFLIKMKLDLILTYRNKINSDAQLVKIKIMNPVSSFKKFN